MNNSNTTQDPNIICTVHLFLLLHFLTSSFNLILLWFAFNSFNSASDLETLSLTFFANFMVTCACWWINLIKKIYTEQAGKHEMEQTMNKLWTNPKPNEISTHLILRACPKSPSKTASFPSCSHDCKLATHTTQHLATTKWKWRSRRWMWTRCHEVIEVKGRRIWKRWSRAPNEENGWRWRLTRVH